LAAKEKLDQANEIFETLGDTSNVAKLLGARAAVLRDLNEFGEALTLLEKQERLCESSGHVLGKATACANIVTLLHRLGRSEEAMTIAQEVIQVATLNGYREVAKHMCNVVREWNDQG